MDNIYKNIKSSYENDDLGINDNFKIIAGAGAGKTHWLIQHIKRILQESDKLTVGKVACISYTTVAVDEIEKRLSSNERVECSTIHSFLYRNVLKPYFHFIKDDFDYIPFEKIKGHYEHFPSYDKIMNLILSHEDFKANIELYTNKKAVIEIFNSFSYSIIKNELLLTISKNNKLKLPETHNDYNDYKKTIWSTGILHHEDVLFFAYKILEKEPKLYKVLAAKFPYVFIDEFQDTNEIQTIFLKQIAANGSIIGIIGDAAQAIFKFAGARVEDFNNFEIHPKQIKEFKIEGNRRSTEQIIKFLNFLRTQQDEKYPIQQHKIETLNNLSCEISGVYAMFENNAVEHWQQFILHTKLPDTTEVKFISHTNYAVDKINNLLSKTDSLCEDDVDFWKEIKGTLGDWYAFFYILAKIIFLTSNKNFIDAINTLEFLHTNLPFLPNKNKKFIINKINIIHKFNTINQNTTIGELYKYTLGALEVLPDVLAPLDSNNNINSFLEKSAMSLANNVRLISSENYSAAPAQTIHKVKGEEFLAVVMTIYQLKTDKDPIQTFIQKILARKEYYVGASRAKKYLILSFKEKAEEIAPILQHYFPDIKIIKMSS